MTNLNYNEKREGKLDKKHAEKQHCNRSILRPIFGHLFLLCGDIFVRFVFPSFCATMTFCYFQQQEKIITTSMKRATQPPLFLFSVPSMGYSFTFPQQEPTPLTQPERKKNIPKQQKIVP